MRTHGRQAAEREENPEDVTRGDQGDIGQYLRMSLSGPRAIRNNTEVL